jgi:hypothetical protein
MLIGGFFILGTENCVDIFVKDINCLQAFYSGQQPRLVFLNLALDL